MSLNHSGVDVDHVICFRKGHDTPLKQRRKIKIPEFFCEDDKITDADRVEMSFQIKQTSFNGTWGMGSLLF